MSRTFSDSIEDDVEQIFLNTDEFAVTVTLTRSLLSTAGIAAIVVNRSESIGTEAVTETDIEERDYRIQASKYVINGSAVDPRDGDRITEVLASGVTIISEVLPLNGKRCFEPDASGTLLLVHTKRIQ